MVVYCRDEKPAIQAVIVDEQGVDEATAMQIGQHVRKEAGYEAIPIVALTLHSSLDEKLREAGFSSCLVKPLRHATVATNLLQAFGVGAQPPAKKVHPDPKLLVGKRILVVRDHNKHPSQTITFLQWIISTCKHSFFHPVLRKL